MSDFETLKSINEELPTKSLGDDEINDLDISFLWLLTPYYMSSSAPVKICLKFSTAIGKKRNWNYERINNRPMYKINEDNLWKLNMNFYHKFHDYLSAARVARPLELLLLSLVK